MEATTQQEHLDTLLQFTSALRIKQSLQSSLFAYLMEINPDMMPLEFKKVVEDHYYLIQFFEKLE